MSASIQEVSNVASCPKYESCSAPICPLNSNWKNARHRPGERICFYLCEAQKEGAEAIFDSVGRGYLYRLMVEATSEISNRYSVIRIALAKAAKSGSRMSTKPPRSKSSAGSRQ
jgi:hypothetical protein